jgi:hypothetical protein
MASKKSGKIKVCVTYMAKGRSRKVCKKLTKRQILKLVGLPKNLKGLKITSF